MNPLPGGDSSRLVRHTSRMARQACNFIRETGFPVKQGGGNREAEPLERGSPDPVPHEG